MIENYKIINIVSGIIIIISLIFCIFGLIAYTKLSNEKFQNSNISTFKNSIPLISSSSNQDYCIPCTGKGNTYTDVDGKSVQCNTIANYLTTPDGKNTLIAAMKNIDDTKTFNFNIKGNAFKNQPANKLKVNSAATAGSASQLESSKCAIKYNEAGFMYAQCGDPNNYYKGGTSMVLGSTKLDASNIPGYDNKLNEPCFATILNYWNMGGTPYMEKNGHCVFS